MNKNEMQTVKEYHFEKIKRCCQRYVNRENDYKVNNGDTRLVEIIKLVAELDTRCTRIKEIDTMLNGYEN